MNIDPVILLILSSLLTAINYLFWSRIKRIEKDTSANTIEIHEIQSNYITRFDDIKTSLHTVEKNIIERIHEFETSIITNYVRKNDCKNSNK